jgi:hypothetical protein
MSRLYIVLGGLALALLTLVPAAADPRTESNSVWAVADRCAREAARLFPDYTPQSNADRENYRRACLRANNEPAPNGQAAISNN